MIRQALTEIGIFLIPFAVYALFLIATRSGLLVQTSWPIHLVARLVLASLFLIILSLVMLANFSGSPPNSTYVPAHVEHGKLVQGVETSGGGTPGGGTSGGGTPGGEKSGVEK